jgi:hypothetical protein
VIVPISIFMPLDGSTPSYILASTATSRHPPVRIPADAAAVENPHLSNRLPGNDTRDQGIAAMAVRNRDTQTSRHHDVECIGDVILAEKSLAAWNAHPFEFSIERGESGLVKRAQ